MNSRIENIVIHHTATPYGSAVEIDKMHRVERGWNRIGYHAVFLNGFPNFQCWKNNDRHRWCDGWMEWGRPFDCDDVIETDEVGAHAYGWNGKSIGLVFVGGFQGEEATTRQLINMRCVIVHHLLPMWKHLSINSVIGHNEVPGGKDRMPRNRHGFVSTFLSGLSLGR